MNNLPKLISKWKPIKSTDFVGNERFQRVARGVLANDGCSPNLLLTGDYGCGKTHAAHWLIRSLLCANSPASPGELCLKCENCENTDLREGNAGVYALAKKSQDGKSDLLFQTMIVDCSRVCSDDLFERTRDLEHLHGTRVILLDEAHHLGRSKNDEKLLLTMDNMDAFWIACTATPNQLSRAFTRRFTTRLLLSNPATVEVVSFLRARCEEYGIEWDFDALLEQIAIRSGNRISDCLGFLAEVVLVHGNRITTKSIQEFAFQLD